MYTAEILRWGFHSCVHQITWTHLLEEALGLCSPKHKLVGEELFCRIYKDILLNLVITQRLIFTSCAIELISNPCDRVSYC